MAKRLKYKIVNNRGNFVHHSFNKRNAEKWVKDSNVRKKLKIRKIK